MNKRVFITGGAKRLGKSMVMFFAKEGYDVLVHVNESVSEGQQLIAELNNQFPNQKFQLFSFNLKDWKNLDSKCEQFFMEFGLPHVIVHNASAYLEANLENVTNLQMEEMMAIHLFSPMVIGKVFKRKAGKGQIISILDSAISTNNSSHGMYLLAKKALKDYSKMSALEWAPLIRVNCIALGPVLPPEGKDKQYFNKVVSEAPLSLQVSEGALHTSLLYLIKNANVTGQTLFCDSGQHLM